MKATAKVAAVATGLALATSMLSLAPIAHAASCSFTTDLTIGSTGAAVTCLQSALIAGGYSIPAGATGYFGTQTRAAVAAWQTAAGVAPAVGYFGPISRAAFNLDGGSSGGTSTVPGCVAGAMFSSTTGQSCTTTTVPGCAPGALFSSTTGQSCGGGTPDTTGPLAGTDGSITDVSKLGSYNNEDVAEGNNNVRVLGADIEASSDGDIALKSVKVSFDSTGNTGSDNLDDYLDSVSIWIGSTQVGSADVSDFTEDSTGLFSKSITLSGATTIRAKEIVKLYIAVDAAGNIDSGDISGDSWTVDIENIRFVDGGGVTTTDTSTGGTDGIDGMDVSIDFVSFSTSANTELKVSTATDTPVAGIVVIDDTANTDDVSLLKGKLKLEGTSDVTLDELPVTLTTVGGIDVDAVTGSITLKIGGSTYTETVTTATVLTATITFDNLDFVIEAGETVAFEILADINDIDAGNLDEGDTLKAEVTSTNRDYMDVENSKNDQLSDSTEKSGTATGEAQEFRTNGIMLTFVSASTALTVDDGANNDLGTFTIKYKVTAVGDTVYVSTLSEVSLSAVTAGYTTALPDRAGTATIATGGSSTTLTNLTDTTLNTAGLHVIEDGSSETFELTTTLQLPHAGTASQYRVVLGGVSWSTSATDATPNNAYTSNLDAFKTSYLALN